MIIVAVLDLVPPLAALLPHSASPYMALMLIGFVIGILGHLSSARWLVAAGVILIFLGAFLFPVAVNFTQDSPRKIETPEESARTLETLP
jgi:ABC-type Mn2+/Zn2+ transport system permease subunit